MILALSGLLVIQLIEETSAASARASAMTNNRIQDQAIYSAALTTYTSAVNARTLCLEGVDRSLAMRAQLQIAVSAAEDAGFYDFAEAFAAGPILGGESRHPEECGPAAPLPIVPASLK